MVINTNDIGIFLVNVFVALVVFTGLLIFTLRGRSQRPVFWNIDISIDCCCLRNVICTNYLWNRSTMVDILRTSCIDYICASATRIAHVET